MSSNTEKYLKYINLIVVIMERIMEREERKVVSLPLGRIRRKEVVHGKTTFVAYTWYKKDGSVFDLKDYDNVLDAVDDKEWVKNTLFASKIGTVPVKDRTFTDKITGEKRAVKVFNIKSITIATQEEIKDFEEKYLEAFGVED